MKKLLSVLLVALMALTLVGCSSSSTTTTDETATDEGTTKYQVGVVQLVQHEALDAATQGFSDALVDEFGEDGVDVVVKNASGESSNCITIANDFVSDGVDLIMANATAALQAASAATDTIPVVGTSITDYATALDIDNWTGTVGTNVTGATDLAPLADQAAMVKEVFPDAKTVGILYCNAEANSVYQANVMTEELTKLGFTVTSYTFTDSNDVTSVTQTAAENSDVIYIPTDNTAANNTEAIANVVLSSDYATPVVAGEEGICKGCGVVTLSISYYDMGYKAGQLAASILKGETTAQASPIVSVDTVTYEYNATNAELLGVTVPSNYVAIAE